MSRVNVDVVRVLVTADIPHHAVLDWDLVRPASRIPRMWSDRALIRALLLLCALAASGCGAAERDAGPSSGQPMTTVRGHGLRVDLPVGWQGEVVRPAPPGALTLRAANFPLPAATDVGQQAQRAMTARDVLITLSYYGRAKDDSRVEQGTLPLAIARADFASFEGFARP
jgi:hypothetical protein